MKRRTTTQKINSAITDKLLIPIRAECYHKTTRQTEAIDNSTLVENLQFLSESGCFTDCIGWTFEKDFKTGNYIAECSRTDGNSENVVTTYLRVNDSSNVEDIERTLLLQESE